MLRFAGGWIELERPVASAVVIGELGSMAEGARGVSPTDGRTVLASARPCWRVSSAVCQSLRAMELLRPRGRRRRTAVAVGIYSSAWMGFRNLFVISILLVALFVSRMEQLSYVFLYGVLVCVCFPEL